MSNEQAMLELADELEKLCCAETEGKFFDCVTDNIATIVAALRVTTPHAEVRKPVSFMEAMNIVECGFDTWKDKPHNARWYSRIDGTPIPNDLKVNIAEAICHSSVSRPVLPGSEKTGEVQS